MARITVEDCLQRVPNRFELVILAAKRARQLDSGEVEPTVEWENDKSTVVALREIAEGTFTEEDEQDANQDAAFDFDIDVKFSADDLASAISEAASETFDSENNNQEEEK